MRQTGSHLRSPRGIAVFGFAGNRVTGPTHRPTAVDENRGGKIEKILNAINADLARDLRPIQLFSPIED